MNSLKSYIQDVPNFPKEGIHFKDITSLLQSPEGVAECLELLLSQLLTKKVDKVVAIEARGFFLGCC
jgi:adenine phosphoribosyltransferase